MADDKVLEIIKFAQSLDLHGRSAQFATHLKGGKLDEALTVCDAAILDSEEMTRPDRTIFRRNVHEKNQRKLKQLRGMVAELKG